MNNTFVYEHSGALYINLTNKCTNNCEFCIRNQMDGIDGYDLWLTHDPNADEVMENLEQFDVPSYSEVVFCGYGEPTMRLDALIEVARRIKTKYPGMKTRINTNGQANLYFKRDITPWLERAIDRISISLNAPDKEEYQNICHSDFGEDAFDGLLEFAKLAKRYVPSVRLTVVDVIGEEKIERCKKLADERGLKLVVREAI